MSFSDTHERFRSALLVSDIQSLSTAEKLAVRAVLLRLAHICNGSKAGAEDWQQIAQAAEWVTHKPAAAVKTPLTHADMWIERDGSPWTGDPATRVDVQRRSGKVTLNVAAGGVSWAHTGSQFDVLAYRFAH